MKCTFLFLLPLSFFLLVSRTMQSQSLPPVLPTNIVPSIKKTQLSSIKTNAIKVSNLYISEIWFISSPAYTNIYELTQVDYSTNLIDWQLYGLFPVDGHSRNIICSNNVDTKLFFRTKQVTNMSDYPKSLTITN